MKKILGIIILGLFLHGCATQAPSTNEINNLIENKIKIGMSSSDFYNLSSAKPITPCTSSGSGLSYLCDYTVKIQNYAFVIWNDYNFNDGGRGYEKVFIFEKKQKYFDFRNNNKLIAIKNNLTEASRYLIDKDPYAKTLLAEVHKWESESQETLNRPKETDTTKVKDITFDLDMKKKQCLAIGYTSSTDKFADCVLRLVELDVKEQLANKISLAQSQGNKKISDELKKQRNSQQGDYLIELGQKLLNPQSKVQRSKTCTVSGGYYKTVNCW